MGVCIHEISHPYMDCTHVTYHAVEACSGPVHVGAELNRGESQVHLGGKLSVVSLRTLQVPSLMPGPFCCAAQVEGDLQNISPSSETLCRLDRVQCDLQLPLCALASVPTMPHVHFPFHTQGTWSHVPVCMHENLETVHCNKTIHVGGQLSKATQEKDRGGVILGKMTQQRSDQDVSLSKTT